MENNSTIKSLCPAAKKCAGCQLQNLPYPEQLKLKQSMTVKYLGKLCHVRDIIGMENPYHYRNKVSAAFGKTPKGEIISGIYQSSTHNIVRVDSCLIEDEAASAIAVTVRALLKSFKLLPYDEKSGRGFLRHTLVKRGFSTGELMVVLVTATPVFPSKRSFVNALLQRHPDITTVVQNVNNRFTSMVLGDNEQVLYGKGYIEDILCGNRFMISSKSFYQINPVQTEILYNTAIEFAGLSGTQTVLDAYCGIGTIGLIAAGRAKFVTGVELNAAAVHDAKANAKLNGIKNINFICCDAGDFMTDAATEKQHCDIAFLDPPRAGCDEKFLTALVKLAPEKIVYISCNPETQARDLVRLSKSGYKAEKLQPVDMFPHTAHIETVVLMSRKDK